jgi:hypothetical protein
MFSEQRTMARNQFTKLFLADSQLVRNGILVRHVKCSKSISSTS